MRHRFMATADRLRRTRVSPEPVVRNFHAALREALVERRVIAVFSTAAPADCATRLACRLGRVPRKWTDGLDRSHPTVGKAVGAVSRTANKRRLNKQRRGGIVTCLHDQKKRYLSEFVSIYEETMRRVKAEHTYFFGEDYFSQLARELGPVLQLFVCPSRWQSCRGWLVHDLRRRRAVPLRRDARRISQALADGADL